ncbi:MAG TPA: FAD-dependent oxidoreductase [Acidobacteriota bacterium]|nr:FAD-dependent oxidoreductase [Acidobacteriota bacterium]
MKVADSIRRERRQDWRRLGSRAFDAVVVGGGISGASVYRELCRRGFRTLLLERGDFACGTSQASAMMAWGGLLYLSHLDVSNVVRLSRARERLIRQEAGTVTPRTFRYLAGGGGRRPWVAGAALWLYWLMGGLRRQPPRRIGGDETPAFLKDEWRRGGFDYQEAVIRPSDARFVAQCVLDKNHPGSSALNYCALRRGTFDRRQGLWKLRLADRLLGCHRTVRCLKVVCAAGPWTDALNARFKIQTPYRHVLSRGVFLGMPLEALGADARRDEDAFSPLIFDTGRDADIFGLIPWGPLALWGPTETVVDETRRGFQAGRQDVAFLLERLNRVLRRPVTAADIVSLRCGVRPLALEAEAPTPASTLRCSKRFHIHADSARPWISVYGGKFTDAGLMACQVADLALRSLACPSGRALPEPKRAAGMTGEPTRFGPRSPLQNLGIRARSPRSPTQWACFPGLEGDFPSARWCRQHEKCYTLADYLRRRTNISQWTFRGGLGRNDENMGHLLELASVFCDGNLRRARQKVTRYRREVDAGLRCLSP